MRSAVRTEPPAGVGSPLRPPATRDASRRSVPRARRWSRGHRCRARSPAGPSTSTNRTCSTRCTTSWAIRSPRRSHQLGAGIEVDQADPDLAPVAGVDGARCVDDREAAAGGEPGARVHEAGVARRQRDRDAGADERALTRRQRHVGGGVQIDARVARAGRTRARADRGRAWSGARRPAHSRAARRSVLWTARAGEHRRGRARRATLPSTIVSDHPHQAQRATSGSTGFDERLSVPLWWYLLAAALGVLLGAEIHMGYPGIRSWIGYATLIPLFVLALVWLGRTRVQVGRDELVVGERRLPLLGGRAASTSSRRRTSSPRWGRSSIPTAYLMHRAWVGPLVRVEVLATPTTAALLGVQRPPPRRAGGGAGSLTRGARACRDPGPVIRTGIAITRASGRAVAADVLRCRWSRRAGCGGAPGSSWHR